MESPQKNDDNNSAIDAIKEEVKKEVKKEAKKEMNEIGKDAKQEIKGAKKEIQDGLMAEIRGEGGTGNLSSRLMTRIRGVYDRSLARVQKAISNRGRNRGRRRTKSPKLPAKNAQLPDQSPKLPVKIEADDNEETENQIAN